MYSHLCDVALFSRFFVNLIILHPKAVTGASLQLGLLQFYPVSCLERPRLCCNIIIIWCFDGEAVRLIDLFSSA